MCTGSVTGWTYIVTEPRDERCGEYRGLKPYDTPGRCNVRIDGVYSDRVAMQVVHFLVRGFKPYDAPGTLAIVILETRKCV